MGNMWDTYYYSDNAIKDDKSTMEGANGITSFYWTAEGIAHTLSFFLPILSSMQKWAEKNNQDSIYEHLQEIIHEVDSLSESLSDMDNRGENV